MGYEQNFILFYLFFFIIFRAQINRASWKNWKNRQWFYSIRIIKECTNNVKECIGSLHAKCIFEAEIAEFFILVNLRTSRNVIVKYAPRFINNTSYKIKKK